MSIADVAAAARASAIHVPIPFLPSTIPLARPEPNSLLMLASACPSLSLSLSLSLSRCLSLSHCLSLPHVRSESASGAAWLVHFALLRAHSLSRKLLRSFIVHLFGIPRYSLCFMTVNLMKSEFIMVDHS